MLDFVVKNVKNFMTKENKTTDYTFCSKCEVNPCECVVVKENKMWEEFIEKGADLEHDRWARWHEYFLSKCLIGRNGNNGNYILELSPNDYERWYRQTQTNLRSRKRSLRR